MYPAVPAELHTLVESALQCFFSTPACLLPYEQANTFQERAQILADHLCGKKPVGSAAADDDFVMPLLPAPGKIGKRRVLLTGCFDLMHAGHYNALRQAKFAFPGEEVELVAGVHSDKSIEQVKGAPTVLNNSEREELVRACRWVDEVAGDLPYAVPLSLLDGLGCDFAVHGDDLPKTSDGSGLFDEVIAAERLRTVKRTEGTSTTILIGRLLSMSQQHLLRSQTPQQRCHGQEPALVGDQVLNAKPESSAAVGVETPAWMLLPTMSRMAVFFGDRLRTIGQATRVVYVPGEWDLFHIGHVRFLQSAKDQGDFVIVGCYDDETIQRKKGKNYPLQALHERALNVLACKYADDVLLAAPWKVTQDLLTSLNVAVVVTGFADGVPADSSYEGLDDPFQVPRDSGLLRIMNSQCSLTMDAIADRISENTTRYVARQEKKERAEREYNDSKSYVIETTCAAAATAAFVSG